MTYYLKPHIKMEPLIWGWYAWPYLIPPITAACNIVERHLKVMESYLENPQDHAQAVADPQLLGGPFIDLDGQQTDEIEELIKTTTLDCKNLILIENALKEFDEILQTEAIGDSLDDLYNRVPEPLKGLIELVYDLNSQPSMRFIEPLIYKKYYTEKYQTIVLSESIKDEREFVLSTPRLGKKDEVYLNVPFSSLELDELFKIRTQPKDLHTILNMFDIPQSKQEIFKSFFSVEPPIIPLDCQYTGNGIRIRYFGHACILVETKTTSILIDPVISYPIKNSTIERYTFLDLPNKIDYVIITHNHQDHLMFETLLQLRHKIRSIVVPNNHVGALADPSVKLILQNIGFSSIIELKEMESISFAEGEIVGIPFFGEHSDLNIQSKLSYLVKIKGEKILFAADSNNIESSLYDHIFNEIGQIDMLFIGMECDGAPLTWLYGPLLTRPLKRTYDRNRSLSGSNAKKAWEIVKKSQCKKAYIYAMGQEPWLNYVMALKYAEDSIQIVESNKLINMCKENAIESEKLFGKKEWIIYK